MIDAAITSAATMLGEPRAQRLAPTRDPEDARRVAKDFEAMFLGQMLATMFEGIETDGMFGGGAGERMFRSLQVEEYAKALARNGGIGIAANVERELLSLNEVGRG